MKQNLSLVLVFILLLTYSLKAQIGDYKAHTVYIYNFTKYIQWPATYQTGDFVIAVYGLSPITAQLRAATANKTVGNQKIVVKQYLSPNAIENPHILFVTLQQSKNLETIKKKLEGKSTLIVTEKPGLGTQSHINFILREGKWKIELNNPAVEAIGLKVSPQLARVAIPVK